MKELFAIACASILLGGWVGGFFILAGRVMDALQPYYYEWWHIGVATGSIIAIFGFMIFGLMWIIASLSSDSDEERP